MEVASSSFRGCPKIELTIVQCLAESFGVDPDSESDKSTYSLAPASLLSLLDVYLKTKAKSAPASASSSTPAPAASTPAPAKASGDNKAAAEALKLKGNALMSQKLYDSAIEQYTEAIKLDANPVYYSNRAAAWGGLGEHGKAVEDAEKAIELDPKFSKAYSRLGFVCLRIHEIMMKADRTDTHTFPMVISNPPLTPTKQD
jgi:small glutamine-rich tetratricopeptide repeat-containing protein alpha